MNRRRFITAVGAAGATSLAGCMDLSEPQPEITTIYSEGTTLLAEVENPGQADSIVFQPKGGESTTTEVTINDPVATFDLGDPQTVGTEDQKFASETEFDVWVFVEDEGRVTSKTWTLRPEPELVKVHKAVDLEYTPKNHDPRATPVLEVKNTGNGPGRLQELVALNVDDPVPIAGEQFETTAFGRTALAYAPGEDGVSAVTTHEDGGFYIPEGFSAFYALDGYFTHTGASPEQVESADQSFDVALRWFGGESQFTVVAELKEGIIQSNGDEDYRFGRYDIVELDHSSPLE